MPFLAAIAVSFGMFYLGTKLRRDAQRRDALLMQEHPDDPFWEVAPTSFEQGAGEALIAGGALVLLGSVVSQQGGGK